ncbi:5-hydroxytryptamine receptor 3A-like [Pempheris klunzingeri]|uniref:5-hydroxytryptamine receptor 3A-like n=1 Tax=Pempheris klunzingeri TaxID=3127111 RepID=UPI0039814513
MAALWILAFLALIGFSSSQTSDCSYLVLLKHLNLTQANDVLQIMRPVKNWATATLVQLDMLVYGILGVDEKSQTITSHIWIHMQWTNEFLTWNSSDFCGINMLNIPRSRLWIPDVSIQEDASDSGSIKHSPFVSLSSNGSVQSNSRQRLTSTCQLDLLLFPFDFQNCNITFFPMSSEASVIELGTLVNDSTVSELSELIMVTRGEWDLEDIVILLEPAIKGGSKNGKLVYSVKLVRKPMLYVINLIVPLFYLLVLDLASFFINGARGEKLGFKVTILLSISVLLLILKDMLPSTEENLPLMANYCVVIFALVGLSVLEAMLVSFLSDLDDYQKAERSVKIELEADNHKEPDLAQEEGQMKPQQSHLPLNGPSSNDLLNLLLEEMKAARQEAERRDTDMGVLGFYKRQACIIDTVFFFLYFLTVVIYLIYMYSIWIHQYCIS